MTGAIPPERAGILPVDEYLLGHHSSNEKIRFRSVFMLMTFQPFFRASS